MLLGRPIPISQGDAEVGGNSEPYYLRLSSGWLEQELGVLAEQGVCQNNHPLCLQSSGPARPAEDPAQEGQQERKKLQQDPISEPPGKEKRFLLRGPCAGSCGHGEWLDKPDALSAWPKLNWRKRLTQTRLQWPPLLCAGVCRGTSSRPSSRDMQAQ